MATTTSGFRYPVSADDPDIPRDIRQLAEDIDNYFTQTTAYAIMWQELFNVPIKNICIIISCEDGGVQVFERNPVNYVRKLKNAIDTFREEHNGLKTISE